MPDSSPLCHRSPSSKNAWSGRSKPKSPFTPAIAFASAGTIELMPALPGIEVLGIAVSIVEAVAPGWISRIETCRRWPPDVSVPEVKNVPGAICTWLYVQTCPSAAPAPCNGISTSAKAVSTMGTAKRRGVRMAPYLASHGRRLSTAVR